MCPLRLLCVAVSVSDGMCTKPITGYYSRSVNPSGKRSLVFAASEGFSDRPIQIPCGQCIECRLERSRQWAMRCVAEASLWPDNIFLTLTYDDIHLPDNFSLVKRDLQLFFKRLRKEYGSGIRYFAAGEYGDKSQRPHYHAIIFNFKPHDGENVHLSGRPLYISRTLARLWPYGFHSYGDVTFESAAYVARYCLKKLTGPLAESYGLREPEFALMSRRPGIGSGWFDKYHKDVYPGDRFIIRDGQAMNPPRYFDSLYQRHFSDFDAIKGARKAKSFKSYKKAVSELPEAFTDEFVYKSFYKCMSDLVLAPVLHCRDEYQQVILKRKETLL